MIYSYNIVKIEIEKELVNHSNKIEFTHLYEPVDYILSIGGKRFRPCITVMSGNLFSQEIQHLIQPALAMEIFHNFTLMHDDIMDNASLRRGMETVHVKWNISTAILSGDVMLIDAYEKLCATKNEKIISILSVFNKTAREVCEGQQMDMDFEKKEVVLVDSYLKMIELKTAVLLGCCCATGALASGASSEDANQLYLFGKNLGMCFQIQDDYLDAFGEQQLVGKKKGGDILQNKKTYLRISLEELMSNEDQMIFRSIIEIKEEEEKISRMIEFYKRYQVDEKSKIMMHQYYNIALHHLNLVQVEKEKKIQLMQLAKSMYMRNA